MTRQKAYIKYHTDNNKWVFLTYASSDQIMTFDSVDQAEDYLYLKYGEDRYDFMVVTYD